jgi:hypothetical protein
VIEPFRVNYTAPFCGFYPQNRAAGLHFGGLAPFTSKRCLMLQLATKIVAGGKMVNRRSVLKIGAATAAGALVKMPASGRNLSPPPARSAFQRAVFDERFAECPAFAAGMRRAGVFTSAISGDVAKLWYDDLRKHLSENRLPVAGLTDRAASFCLEELARDVGMRVVFRADHIMDQDGHAQHAAVGPASLVAATRGLPPEAGFGRAMAGVLNRFDIGEPRDTAAQKRSGPFSPENKTALVSWIIA